jgi:hypothetical protein
MEIILLLVLIVYSLFIAQLTYGFNKVKTFEKTELKPKTSFSIIA